MRDGAHAFVLNNLIYDCYESSRSGKEDDCGMGIFVRDDSKGTILGNAIWNCYLEYDGGSSYQIVRGDSLVYAPLGTVLRHNNLWKNNTQVDRIKGTVTANDNPDADPLFVNSAAGNFTLQVTSPCIDVGPPDPQYNDRDGTRNDIGMYGGHSFIPDGRTTNKPIVLGLEVAPIAVPVGGIITIRSTGATTK